MHKNRLYINTDTSPISTYLELRVDLLDDLGARFDELIIRLHNEVDDPAMRVREEYVLVRQSRLDPIPRDERHVYVNVRPLVGADDRRSRVLGGRGVVLVRGYDLLRELLCDDETARYGAICRIDEARDRGLRFLLLRNRNAQI